LHEHEAEQQKQAKKPPLKLEQLQMTLEAVPA
jgi:hypothetical protein